jgi:predicted Rossmann-fold nucleotide-binding protein
MRVLVCGGRHYNDEERVNAELDALVKEHGWIIVIEGGATGADTLARNWATLHRGEDVALKTFEAEWRLHGRKAGPIRNRRMLIEGQPDLVLAFPGGSGTSDMVGKAMAAGVRIIEVK